MSLSGRIAPLVLIIAVVTRAVGARRAVMPGRLHGGPTQAPGAAGAEAWAVARAPRRLATGLGLALVPAIVSDLSGAIDVKNTPGREMHSRSPEVCGRIIKNKSRYEN